MSGTKTYNELFPESLKVVTSREGHKEASGIFIAWVRHAVDTRAEEAQKIVTSGSFLDLARRAPTEAADLVGWLGHGIPEQKICVNMGGEDLAVGLSGKPFNLGHPLTVVFSPEQTPKIYTVGFLGFPAERVAAWLKEYEEGPRTDGVISALLWVFKDVSAAQHMPNWIQAQAGATHAKINDTLEQILSVPEKRRRSIEAYAARMAAEKAAAGPAPAI